ncbi:EAL domain-containing protein [Aquipuribacter sp. MA13-6]|uniref:EAL domain-containing protein n=1 Tax=unclassified Aquipuribacter TaxID=2635084 RepID=UPI003EE9C6FF
MPRPAAVAAALLVLGLLTYAAFGSVPVGPFELYTLVSVATVVVAWVGLTIAAPERPWAWRWLLLGYSAWVTGDLVWLVENEVLGLDMWPAWSDLVYLVGYVALAAGALTMVRTRRAGRDRTAVLDAAIVAVGVGVPAFSFVIAPAATAADVGLLGRFVTTAYPLLDLFLLAVLARLLATPGALTAAYRLLIASLAVTLVTDIAWNVGVVSRGTGFESRWLDVGWLLGYVLLALATMSRSLRASAEAPPHHEPVVATRRRLLALAAASTLPAVTLALHGWMFGEVPWLSLAVGSALLSLLVLLRMAGLLEQVQVQAVQLAALARVDGLTGIPNRRTWDHELSRACAAARRDGTPLAVAILDLDRFKRYNDRHGHQAGDRLLREAASAWTEVLDGSGAMLARYGGEEFSVLLPGMDTATALPVLRRLREVTPGAQSFSAGLAVWDPETDPDRAIGAADGALYEAKRRGRDRVVVAHADAVCDGLPGWARSARVVVQPVVDVNDGTVIGHEALARFEHDHDVPRVFAQAHEDGIGDLLEAHLVTLATAVPGRPAGSLLFVNVSPAALASPRFWERLPADLTGVVVELVEERLVGRVEDHDDVAGAAAGLRARGAVVAVDDLGAGTGDLGRLLAVLPDIVKIDREVVSGCATDPRRLRLVELVVGLSAAVGARVCAEGVETAEDLQALRGCGVHLAQGYHLGRPADGWADATRAVPPGPVVDVAGRPSLLPG